MAEQTLNLEGMLFTKEHEWVELDGDGTGTTGRIGITQYAVDQLGEIVYLDLAAPGTPLAQGKRLGEVESVKSVSDIFSPVSGLVTAINQAVVDHPELVNKEPYGQGWLVKASDIRHDELTGLMTHSQYQSYLAGQAHH